MKIIWKQMDTAPTESGARIVALVDGNHRTTAYLDAWDLRGQRIANWRLLVPGSGCDDDTIEPLLWAEYSDET